MFTVTFYSYKGGVGRTLALANAAYALASINKASVAILDFDLEAPGIDSIPPFNTGKKAKKGGIVEYISNYRASPSPDPQNLPSILPYSYSVKELENLTVIPAGKKDENYQISLTQLNWEELYKRRKGYHFFEGLKKKIEEEINPDYLLIDSRTGLADISGITTHQLADLVVLVFNLNPQNLEGIAGVYRSILKADKPEPVKMLLVASPVPKDQLSDESELLRRFDFVAENMKESLNPGGGGKEPPILIPYHPMLALDDFIFLKRHPHFEIAQKYRLVADRITQNNTSDVRFLLDEAIRLAREDRVEEADFEFLNVIGRRPKDPRVYFYYGEFLLDQKKNALAVEQLRKACQLDPDNVEYLSVLAKALVREGKMDQALEILEKAETLDPENVSVLETICSLHLRRKDHEKYKKYLLKVQGLKLPSTVMDKPNPVKAFEELYPPFMDGNFGYPEQFDRQAFWDELKSCVSMGFVEKGRIIVSILSRKITYFQAQQVFEIFKEETKKFSEVLGDKIHYVKEKMRSGELESINNEGDLKNLAESAPENQKAVFYYLLSIIQLSENKELALKNIALAVQCATPDMDVAGLYFSWGIYLGEMAGLKENLKDKDKDKDKDKEKLYKEACEKYQKAVEIKPDSHDAFYSWSSALIHLYYLKEDEIFLKEALRKAQKAEEIREGSGAYNMACAYSLLKDKANALKYLKKAIEDKPHNKELAAKDKDFDFLRPGKAFQKLMEM